jgi:hypothetical protein
MSDEFHRPTLTFPTGAYNATQVRLYGLAPKSPDAGLLYPGKATILNTQAGDYEVQVSVTTNDPKEDQKLAKDIPGLIKELRELEKCEQTDAEIFKSLVSGSQSLIKDTLPIAYGSTISIQIKHLGSVSISATITQKQARASGSTITCGIIVGYAYEGHTYDLPKPKIMIIPTLPESKIPHDDSGFDEKPDYAVWLVDKLDECVEFELNQGFVEQLILDANLPGKRAPNMYAGRMMMGHRSGRLTE